MTFFDDSQEKDCQQYTRTAVSQSKKHAAWKIVFLHESNDLSVCFPYQKE